MTIFQSSLQGLDGVLHWHTRAGLFWEGVQGEVQWYLGCHKEGPPPAHQQEGPGERVWGVQVSKTEELVKKEKLVSKKCFKGETPKFPEQTCNHHFFVIWWGDFLFSFPQVQQNQPFQRRGRTHTAIKAHISHHKRWSNHYKTRSRSTRKQLYANSSRPQEVQAIFLGRKLFSNPSQHIKVKRCVHRDKHEAYNKMQFYKAQRYFVVIFFLQKSSFQHLQF